jgi:hypothetical protein
VAVLGAAGGIGQPLSLLMKLSPHVSELSLYDVVNTPGVAVDLSHINTACKVRGYVGAAQLGDALKGCQLVIIPAGGPLLLLLLLPLLPLLLLLLLLLLLPLPPLLLLPLPPLLLLLLLPGGPPQRPLCPRR